MMATSKGNKDGNGVSGTLLGGFPFLLEQDLDYLF